MQSIHALEQSNTCSAVDVQAVLLWREPMQTSKVFLAGMYILVCLRQLVSGQLTINLRNILCMQRLQPGQMQQSPLTISSLLIPDSHALVGA